MAATAIGGTGSANGAGYAGGRNLFDVTNSDVTMASFVMFNPDRAAATRARNSTRSSSATEVSP